MSANTPDEIQELYAVRLRLEADPSDEQWHRSAHRILNNISQHTTGLFAEHQPCIRTVLECLMSGNVIHPRFLAYQAADLILQTNPLPEGTSPQFDPPLLNAWSQDRLLRLLLEKTINIHPTFEQVLTRLRHHLLSDFRIHQQIPKKRMSLLIALTHQCFNNEYIFHEEEEERQAVDLMIPDVEHALECGTFQAMGPLLLHIGMYRPLSRLSFAHRLGEISPGNFSKPVQAVLERLLYEPLREQNLAFHMPSLSSITDETSQAVRQQYEENPYPRWLNLYGPFEAIAAIIKKRTPDFSWPTSFDRETFQILVPGCGTGEHPLVIAAGNPDAHIEALDLSKTSLAYGKRMAATLQIPNVTFLHGDLQNISDRKRMYHHIDCVGVLHHMEHPMDGWRALEKVLAPGGTMHIAVYSQVARLPILFIRNEIKKQRITAATASMKAFRHQLMTDEKYQALYQALLSGDFFSLSALRDLLFHVREHGYTLAEIDATIRDLDLEFLHFNLKAAPKHQYRTLFPDDANMNSFENWRQFERYYAGTKHMFEFWVQKKA